ncbi:hypothetical protein [Cellulosimicrobium cellulans]|uniref:hypothetical protein n=1 Tax=Cellulosimicrobium cellulans TaxID=1710 RepID=UPI0024070A76|nr:hypothetical protein [Cellulosimicrobium cellulans]MDF9877377.1 hypothetical protein [Cellulosimicrobium cellulans]
MATRTRNTAHERPTPRGSKLRAAIKNAESAEKALPGGKGESAAAKRDSVTFRPTPEERRILDRLSDEGVTASDAVRRGLHLVAHEKWVDQARVDAENLAHEKLDDEPDAW